jgi:hypothetical protein
MNNLSTSDPKRELLRHGLAAIAYRAGKATRDATESLPTFQASQGVRSPEQLLAHIGDLMNWALSMAIGKPEWHNSKPLPWGKEEARFFAALKRLDDFLASNEPLRAPPEKLLQGPIADTLTHVGQIAMLRRMAGQPMKSENYYEAEIVIGRVGAEQTKPKREY